MWTKGFKRLCHYIICIVLYKYVLSTRFPLYSVRRLHSRFSQHRKNGGADVNISPVISSLEAPSYELFINHRGIVYGVSTSGKSNVSSVHWIL